MDANTEDSMDKGRPPRDEDRESSSSSSSMAHTQEGAGDAETEGGVDSVTETLALAKLDEAAANQKDQVVVTEAADTLQVGGEECAGGPSSSFEASLHGICVS